MSRRLPSGLYEVSRSGIAMVKLLCLSTCHGQKRLPSRIVPVKLLLVATTVAVCTWAATTRYCPILGEIVSASGAGAAAIAVSQIELVATDVAAEPCDLDILQQRNPLELLGGKIDGDEWRREDQGGLAMMGGGIEPVVELGVPIGDVGDVRITQ